MMMILGTGLYGRESEAEGQQRKITQTEESCHGTRTSGVPQHVKCIIGPGPTPEYRGIVQCEQHIFLASE